MLLFLPFAALGKKRFTSKLDHILKTVRNLYKNYQLEADWPIVWLRDAFVQ